MGAEVEINDELSIPVDELRFTASRSKGPGGQHVNKVSSRISLEFDVLHSASLNDAQRRRIRARLETRINKNGVLRLYCQRHRSQAANRAVVVERFAELLRRALERRKPRRDTRVPRAVVKRRIEQKRRRGTLKQRRSKPGEDD